jgi:hypothetical protein
VVDDIAWQGSDHVPEDANQPQKGMGITS